MSSGSDGGGGIALLIIGGILLYNCSSDDSGTSADEDEYAYFEESQSSGEYGAEAESADGDYSAVSRYSGGYYYEDEPEEFDEDAARDEARVELALEGYNYSYGCTIDCSGHEAGWQWSAENDYSTYGNSQSFHEGTMAFEEALEDRVEEMRHQHEDEYGE
ncbi:hypothetical protein [Qipengyuania mesophila]|uniref:hypothetical protein n=1 Tax=Qipengyuania mesophila TaxID=2867246 RepID=UPI003515EF44